MKIRPASTEEWQNFVDNCPEATFFHTPAWYRVWERYAGYRVETLIFEFEEERKALLPMASYRRLRGLTKMYVSSPVGTYGSWLSQNTLSDREQKELSAFLKKRRNLFLTGNPFSAETAPERHQKNWKKDFTQVIFLSNEEHVEENWSVNHRRSLKKSRKAGLEIFTAQTPEDWENYFGLYQQSVARWSNRASNNYAWGLFLELSRLSPDQCRLWLAKLRGQYAAGCLCFYHARHAVYWHGAAGAQFFKHRPNHLLHYAIMKHAVENGFFVYDFNPSGEHAGVVKFKASFGSQKLAFYRLFQKSPLLDVIGRLKTMLNY